MKVAVFDNGAGGVSVIVPAPKSRLSAAEIFAKDAPAGAVQVDAATLPVDRTFRAAWRLAGGAVVEDHAAALAMAHDMRRAKRDAELAPLDREVTVPGKEASAEAARQAVRDRHAQVQIDMDAAPDVDALRALVKGLG